MSGISSYNPLLAYSCLWQTLDSGTWYSVWSTGLSYEFARSLALLLHFMAAYEGNILTTKISVQKKKRPCSKLCSPLTAQGEVGTATSSFSEEQNNARRMMEVFCKSNQCNKIDNVLWYYSNKIDFLSRVVT